MLITIISGLFSTIALIITALPALRSVRAKKVDTLADASDKNVTTSLKLMHQMQSQLDAQVKETLRQADDTGRLTLRCDDQDVQIEKQKDQIDALTGLVIEMEKKLRRVASGARLLVDQVVLLGGIPVYKPPEELFE